MITPRQASAKVKAWLRDHPEIPVTKVRGKTVSFQDLLGKDGVFVLIEHTSTAPMPWMKEVSAAFPKGGEFIVMLVPDTFTIKPV